jgi:hypothetical protein
MKLSELIAKYGDDKVQFQNLDQCIDTIKYDHKKGTKITFGTDVGVNESGMEKLGLIVWFDREEAAKVIAQSKRGGA